MSKEKVEAIKQLYSGYSRNLQPEVLRELLAKVK